MMGARFFCFTICTIPRYGFMANTQMGLVTDAHQLEFSKEVLPLLSMNLHTSVKAKSGRLEILCWQLFAICFLGPIMGLACSKRSTDRLGLSGS